MESKCNDTAEFRSAVRAWGQAAFPGLAAFFAHAELEFSENGKELFKVLCSEEIGAFDSLNDVLSQAARLMGLVLIEKEKGHILASVSEMESKYSELIIPFMNRLATNTLDSKLGEDEASCVSRVTAEITRLSRSEPSAFESIVDLFNQCLMLIAWSVAIVKKGRSVAVVDEVRMKYRELDGNDLPFIGRLIPGA